MSRLASFIREARRRHAFRTGALYVVGAWVVLQVADLAFESFGFPGTALRYLWYAAIAGFPIALVFGWRYDITSSGIRKTPPAPEHLKAAGKAHWVNVLAIIRLEDDERTTLEAACIQADRAAEFRADIDERGAMVPDRFGILKPNMAVQFERLALAEFAALNAKLGLYSDEARPQLTRGYR